VSPCDRPPRTRAVARSRARCRALVTPSGEPRRDEGQPPRAAPRSSLQNPCGHQCSSRGFAPSTHASRRVRIVRTRVPCTAVPRARTRQDESGSFEHLRLHRRCAEHERVKARREMRTCRTTSPRGPDHEQIRVEPSTDQRSPTAIERTNPSPHVGGAILCRGTSSGEGAHGLTETNASRGDGRNETCRATIGSRCTIRSATSSSADQRSPPPRSRSHCQPFAPRGEAQLFLRTTRTIDRLHLFFRQHVRLLLTTSDGETSRRSWIACSLIARRRCVRSTSRCCRTTEKSCRERKSSSGAQARAPKNTVLKSRTRSNRRVRDVECWL
jgi:hypothetical protein